MPRPFNSLADFALHKERSRLELARQNRVMEAHWQAASDGGFHKQLAKNSATKWLDDLGVGALTHLAKAPVLLGAGAAALWSLRSRHPFARVLGSALTFLGPKWLARQRRDRDGGPEDSALTRELRTSWQRLRRYREWQKSARDERHSQDEAPMWHETARS